MTDLSDRVGADADAGCALTEFFSKVMYSARVKVRRGPVADAVLFVFR